MELLLYIFIFLLTTDCSNASAGNTRTLDLIEESISWFADDVISAHKIHFSVVTFDTVQ